MGRSYKARVTPGKGNRPDKQEEVQACRRRVVWVDVGTEEISVEYYPTEEMESVQAEPGLIWVDPELDKAKS